MDEFRTQTDRVSIKDKIEAIDGIIYPKVDWPTLELTTGIKSSLDERRRNLFLFLRLKLHAELLHHT